MSFLDSRLNCTPRHVQSVYLMGIGGVAMGALAGALKNMGLSVRGSDNPLYPPMSTFLQDLGIETAQGYAAQNLVQGQRPDLVVVGNVIRRDNPEVAALASSGLPFVSLPQALAHFFIAGRSSIVVAGTHGKTTTTALIASALRLAGMDPGFLVGGILQEGGCNFARGGGPHFVIEGDEYDCAFFDKRPKFVHYRPRIALLTSLEFDHADIYPHMEAVRTAFGLLAQAMDPGGVLIAWGGSPEVMAVARQASCQVETYGRGEQDWRLLDLLPAHGGGARLWVRTPEEERLDLFTPLPGEHNALNTLACLAALCRAGVEARTAARVQKHFKGVRRRQEVRGRRGGVTVVDDFAHHPTAVKETLKAVAAFGLPGWSPGSGRLVAIFEPRTNTSKRVFFQKDYAQAFGQADLVLLREPPGVEDLPPQDRFSSARLAQSLREKGIEACSFWDTDSLLKELLAALRPGDCALIMSNGGFDDLHRRLLDALEEIGPAAPPG